MFVNTNGKYRFLVQYKAIFVVSGLLALEGFYLEPQQLQPKAFSLVVVMI